MKKLKTKHPLISVIMAVYNSEKYLTEAIESVLNQTFSNFEFIIVNDGSKDGSEDIIKKYLKKDSRIIYLKNNKNLGQSITRNKAIKKATGKYIAIVDSDDICVPTRFKKQVNFLEKNDEIGVLGTNYFSFTSSQNECELVVQSDNFINGKVCVHNPTCMIRKNLFLKYGNFKFKNGEDVEMYYRWFSKGVKFYNLNEPLYKYRAAHGANISDVRKKIQVWAAFKVNMIAIFKNKVRFSLSGYLYTAELFLYFIYLSLNLDKIYKRENNILQHNISAHNRKCHQYEKEHVEIYNDIEQNRLSQIISKALSEVKSGTKPVKCLDFGCGAGNITQYLLKDSSNYVVSADVSEEFLNLIKIKYSSFINKRLDTLLLNGINLKSIENSSFDFIGSYSVLHHVPDYLSIIKEFVRILKPGGVLYIDHEASPATWRLNKYLREYNKLLHKETIKKTRLHRFKHLFVLSYWSDAIKERLNPKYMSEGDIHVFVDDHIEWRKIEKILSDNNVKIIQQDDYLLYNKHCSDDLYNKYKDKIDNTRAIIARKGIK